jgi:hypothetical protein
LASPPVLQTVDSSQGFAGSTPAVSALVQLYAKFGVFLLVGSIVKGGGRCYICNCDLKITGRATDVVEWKRIHARSSFLNPAMFQSG